MDIIAQIAHNLARTCRYGGATTRHYSVAEHTWHMVDEAEQRGLCVNSRLQLWLHDAPEHVIGDVLPILKNDPIIRARYDAIERDVMDDICRIIGLDKMLGRRALLNPLVKEYDNAILIAEGVTVAHEQPGWEPYVETDLQRCFKERIDAITYLPSGEAMTMRGLFEKQGRDLIAEVTR